MHLKIILKIGCALKVSEIMKADMIWLDNPEIFRVYQLDAHSDHNYYISYEDIKKKMEMSNAKSERRRIGFATYDNKNK